jgi:hypothetical protein
MSCGFGAVVLVATTEFYINYSHAGDLPVEVIILPPMQRRTREIVQGQRYRKIGAGGGLWEVVAVRTDASGAIHARMQSIEEPKTFRTFAIGALADMRNFHIVED